MLTVTQNYKRHNPNTAIGHSIEVTIVYSSYDEKDIDNIESDLRQSIGSGITMTFDNEKGGS